MGAVLTYIANKILIQEIVELSRKLNSSGSYCRIKEIMSMSPALEYSPANARVAYLLHRSQN